VDEELIGTQFSLEQQDEEEVFRRKFLFRVLRKCKYHTIPAFGANSAVYNLAIKSLTI